MSKRRNPVFFGAPSGSRIAHQFRLGARGTASSAAASSSTAGVRFLPVTITTGDWTADATLYPDAPDLGTLYRADINHNLGNDRALVLSIQDAAGRSWPDVVLQFQTTEDPTTPGSRRANHLRLWISSDAPPAVTLYAIVIG